MCNMYKRIKNDFAFLNDYGYEFNHIEHHYVMPSIVFRNGVQDIQVGMSYKDNKMFVIYYSNQE